MAQKEDSSKLMNINGKVELRDGFNLMEKNSINWI